MDTTAEVLLNSNDVHYTGSTVTARHLSYWQVTRSKNTYINGPDDFVSTFKYPDLSVLYHWSVVVHAGTHVTPWTESQL